MRTFLAVITTASCCAVIVQAQTLDPQVNSLTVLKPDNTAPTTPITFQTNENGAGNFYFGMGSSPNPFGFRQDQVLTWGYNQLPGASDRSPTGVSSSACVVQFAA